MPPRRRSSRPAPESQNHVAPAPRAFSQRTRRCWLRLAQYDRLRLCRTKISPTPGWPSRSGTLQEPEAMTSAGIPRRAFSCRSRAVSSTMSPNAPQRMTSGRCGLMSARSLQRSRLEACGPGQLQKTALANEMQRADDHEVVLFGLEKTLYLRHPTTIAVGDECVIEPWKAVKVLTHERRKLGGITAAPGGDDLLGLAVGIVHFRHGLVEEGRLIVLRKRCEDADLLPERFQPQDVLAVGVGAPPELPLYAFIRIETELHVLKLRQGE